MDAIARIDRWFDGSHEEGDFFRVERNAPYFIYGPNRDCGIVFYCTKQHIASDAMDDKLASFDAMLVSRSGLPREEDVKWLQDLFSDRQVVFVGDLDPVDVMIFAWLRLRLASTRIAHHGINDQLIGILNLSIPKNYQIELKAIERAAAAELTDIVPDLEKLLGRECLQILTDGNKLELEAIKSTVGSTRPLFSVSS
jgi:hypothetical protein